jgi:SEC-C motif-containing protein
MRRASGLDEHALGERRAAGKSLETPRRPMMKLGNMVWFSSDPRPFVIEEEYCDNPGCPCREVQLTFTRIDHPEGLPSEGVSFWIRVDLDTWQERDPPRRQPHIDSWVREFLSQYPEARKTEFRANYEARKQIAKQLAEYALDPRAVLTGEMVSFADVLTGRQALSSGGRSFTHRFTHQGREYLVEDLYCANPSCDCQAFHVQFWERVTSSDGKEAIISTSFLGRVTFGGQLVIEETGRRRRAESLSILSGWWQEQQHDLDMFQQRYQRVKEIGRRSIGTEVARSDSPGTDRRPPHDDASRLASADSRPKRVGRNDPCPCRSGKKFKHCCAAHIRGSQIPLAR